MFGALSTLQSIHSVDDNLIVVAFLIFHFSKTKRIKSKKAKAQILASRDKRRRQLENVLINAQKQLDDHLSGKKKLKPHQVEHHEHKMNAYQNQLKELSRELDEEVRTEGTEKIIGMIRFSTSRHSLTLECAGNSFCHEGAGNKNKELWKDEEQE